MNCRFSVATVAAAAACLLLIFGCGEETPSPVAEAQFSATPSWGDAPFSTTLSWEIESNRPSDLKCTLDLDGDGTIDEELKSCPLEGSRPWTFAEPGEYNPVLTVSAGGENLAEVRLRVFSNKLTFAPEVVHIDQAEGISGFERTGDTLVLQTTEPDTVPPIEAGTILLSIEDVGLLVRVVSVDSGEGNTMELTTEPVGLDEAIAEGFWGAASTSPSINLQTA